jgi:hypothetical protein
MACSLARRRPDLYVTRSAIMLLADDGEVAGVARIAWRSPRPSLATVWKIEWDPAYVEESAVWDVLEELLGLPITQRAA